MSKKYTGRIGLIEVSLNLNASLNEPIVQVRTAREKAAYELPDLDQVVGITGMQEVDEQIYAVH